ncbi:hypothetical protein ACFVX6_13850 [Streptomyces sp. NPDC058289]|uniref:hypothetical protein n=1 Tax=Streptomyces sp. NPDC058289 TaxID=3346425 RepID=UPI0036E8A397
MEPSVLTPQSTPALQRALDLPKVTSLNGLVGVLVHPEEGRWPAAKPDLWGEGAWRSGTLHLPQAAEPAPGTPKPEPAFSAGEKAGMERIVLYMAGLPDREYRRPATAIRAPDPDAGPFQNSGTAPTRLRAQSTPSSASAASCPGSSRSRRWR